MKSKKIRPYIDEPLFNSIRSLYPNFPGDDSAFLNWLMTSMLACGNLPFVGMQAQALRPQPQAQQQFQPQLTQEVEDDDDLLSADTD